MLNNRVDPQLLPATFGPEAEPNPLHDQYLSYLFVQTGEAPEWDFKSTLSIAKDGDFAKVAKDIFAFANFGGGYLLIGWKKSETGVHEPVGLDATYSVDQATLQEKFRSYSPVALSIDYREFFREVNGQRRKFAAVYIPPSPCVLKPTREGVYFQDETRKKHAFKEGQIFIRRGTASVVAEPHEVAFIERRIKDDQYRIALISGKPDIVREVLHSNLFPVLSLPPRMYSAVFTVGSLPSEVRRRCPCVTSSDRLYAFEDPRETELRTFVSHASVEVVNIEKWRTDPDRNRLFMWLLKECIKSGANVKGMFAHHRPDRVFYPLRSGENNRKIVWRGLHRGAPRSVANPMPAAQFEQVIYVHPAAGIEFVSFDGKLYLELIPTFVLTWDGRRVIKDERVGSVITRLLHDKYNSVYLRDVYFWIEQLETSVGKLDLIDGAFRISTVPLTSVVEFGIIADQMTSINEPETQPVDQNEVSE